MSATDARSKPCVSCGGCCASFRVQFYWREANAEDHLPAVPEGFFEDLTPELRGMRGTSDKHRPKCSGLKGRIGKDAHCSIYRARPTPCREFQASYANGRHDERCDLARQNHGLAPLKREDWSQ